MSNKRELNDIAMMDVWIGGAVQDMFNHNLKLDEQAKMLGLVIADAAAIDSEVPEHIRAGGVREFAKIYNELDRQAVLQAGGDIENYRDNGDIADYIEANARRLGHHAYRMANGLVKSRELRWLHRRSSKN